MQRYQNVRAIAGTAMLAVALLCGFPEPASSAPIPVRVTVENLSPTNGTFLTPVWVSFHNGNFDIYNLGEAATPGLEAFAEDGATGVIASEFLASGAGTVEGTLSGIGPIGPGQSVSATFILDSSDPMSQYFSYASMIIPSNDFFIANANPLAHSIFDGAGNFVGASFVILGSAVRDAGTEVNDELESTTAFFSQAAPNTGTTENGVVSMTTGFIPNGRILSSGMFGNADFTAQGYQIARVTVEAVPEPSTVLLSLLGLGAIAWRTRRRRSAN
ncbi:MAG: spondin domain-containing protein [Bryobacterales bacterium]|nr:spondin domain-containing protein [Bryobacterales bacterium]